MKPLLLLSVFAVSLGMCHPGFPGLHAQEPEREPQMGKELESSLKSVTVFNGEARATRTVSLDLPAGETKFVVTGFPLTMRDDTLGAEVNSPDVLVTSISQRRHFEPVAPLEEILRAKEHVAVCANEVNRLHVQLAKLNNDLNLVTQLRPANPGGERYGKPLDINLDAWNNFFTFSVEKLDKIFLEIRQTNEKIKDAQFEFAKAQQEYAKLEPLQRDKEKAVVVALKSLKPVKINLDISYMVPDAGWSPAYDVRVDQKTGKVSISVYGIVYQRTGENWKDIPILFSTAIPSSSANLPELRKRLITEVFQPSVIALGDASISKEIRLRASVVDKALEEPVIELGMATSGSITPVYSQSAQMRKSKSSYNTAQQAVYQLAQEGQAAQGVNFITFQDGANMKSDYLMYNDDDTVSYRDAKGELLNVARSSIKSVRMDRKDVQGLGITHARLRIPSDYLAGFDYRFPAARLENIPSDGKQYKVLLKTDTYEGTRYYMLAPYRSEYAYLKCEIKNNSLTPILAGPANIFYDTEYVGETDFPMVAKDEIISLNLGVDQRIKVKRETNKMSETVGVFSKSRRTNVETTVTVTNQTPDAFDFRLYENVPVSLREEIKIGNIKSVPEKEVTKDDFLPSGVNFYKGNLAAGKEYQLKISYYIEYPPDFIVTHGIHHNGSFRSGFGDSIDNAATRK